MLGETLEQRVAQENKGHVSASWNERKHDCTVQGRIEIRGCAHELDDTFRDVEVVVPYPLTQELRSSA